MSIDVKQLRQLTFKPGGVPSENVFDNLQLLAASARSLPVGAPKIIAFDGSETGGVVTMVPGAYDFGRNVTFIADTETTTTLVIQDGVTISPPVQTIYGGIVVDNQCTTAPPMAYVDPTYPTFTLRNGFTTFGSSGTQPLVSIQAAGCVVVGDEDATLAQTGAPVFRIDLDGVVASLIARGEFFADDDTITVNLAAPTSSWQVRSDDAAFVSQVQAGVIPPQIVPGSRLANDQLENQDSAAWDGSIPAEGNTAVARLAQRRTVQASMTTDNTAVNVVNPGAGTGWADVPGCSVAVDTTDGNVEIDVFFGVSGTGGNATTIYFRIVYQTGGGPFIPLEGCVVTVGGVGFGFGLSMRKLVTPAPGVQTVKAQWGVAASSVVVNAATDPVNYANLVVSKQ